MKNSKRTRSIALYLGLVMISAAAVFAYFNFAGGKPVCPVLEPAVCPPTEPAAESPVPCAAADLSSQVFFEGAAGTVYGSLNIKNISSKACTIAGNDFPKLNYNKTVVKNLNTVNLGLPSVTLYAIEPGSAVYGQINFANGPQCSSGIHMVNATLTYGISKDTAIKFENVLPQGGQNRPEFSITACDANKDITDIKITNLSDQPVRQR